MARFKYKALDRNAVTVRGELDAANESSAFEALKRRRLEPFEIAEKVTQKQFFVGTKKTKTRDLARYIRQLATLLSAGVTLLEALASLSRSNAHPALAKASQNIRKNLRAGERLSMAMEKHLPRLPPYVPRLAELGEATGQSAKALTDAAERMEYEDTMRTEVRTALSYPIFLAVIGSVIVFLMFLFIVPTFDDMLGSNREKLPFMSRLVMASGVGLKNNLIPVLMGLGVMIAGIVFIIKNEGLKMAVRSTMERMPVIGPVLIQADLGGWARTMGMALDNGADILSALQLGEFGLRISIVLAMTSLYDFAV